MVSEATAAYSAGVGSSPNGAMMLAGPYPLDLVGIRFSVVSLTFLPAATTPKPWREPELLFYE